MNDSSTDDPPRRRRRATKLPLRIVSDIGPDTPVTQAEIDLIIAMVGGPEGMERILRGEPAVPASTSTPVVAKQKRARRTTRPE